MANDDIFSFLNPPNATPKDEDIVDKIMKMQEPPQAPTPTPIDLSEVAPIAAPVVSSVSKQTTSPIAPYIPSKQEDVYGKGLGDADLAKAIKDREQEKSNIDLGKAGATIGASIARVDPNLTLFNEMEKGVGQGVEDIFKQRKSRLEEIEGKAKLADLRDRESLRDPNHPISIAARDLAAQVGMKNMPANLSAEALFKLEPLIKAKLSSDMIHESKSKREKEDAEKQDYKMANDLKKGLSEATSRTNSTLGKSLQTVQAAEAVEMLILGRTTDPNLAGKEDFNKDMSKLNKLTSQQIFEIARGLDRLISRASPTAAATQHLIPKSAVGDVSKIEAYLTNDVTPANMGSFVKNMLETVAREKKLATIQAREAQKKELGASLILKRRNPELYNNVVTPFGLSDAQIEEADKSLKAAKQTTILEKGGQKAQTDDPEKVKAALANGWVIKEVR